MAAAQGTGARHGTSPAAGLKTVVRVLIAPDKFKGSLTAREAAAAMAAGWREAWPEAKVVCRPVADGGEGTAEAVCSALGGTWREHTVHDPLGRPVRARYAVAGATAILECSAASGYGLVSPHDRDLLRASTFGTGELVAHAFAEPDVRKIIVGLGGSATNDGGLGLAAALGYTFLDSAGKPIAPVPGELGRLASIVPPPAQPWLDCPVTAACDVQNPLLGPRGATQIYGPQKGLLPSQEATLEHGLRRLADVAASLGTDQREVPGAGAAGGLGFGLLTFCGATLAPGFGLVAGLLGLEEAVATADLVLTGEGSADAQSLEGKAPYGVAALAKRYGRPVVLVAGHVPPADRPALRAHFDAVFALTDTGLTPESCLRDATNILRSVTAKAARAWRAR